MKVRFTLRAPSDLVEALDEWAEAQGYNRTAAIVLLLRKALGMDITPKKKGKK